MSCIFSWFLFIYKENKPLNDMCGLVCLHSFTDILMYIKKLFSLHLTHWISIDIFIPDKHRSAVLYLSVGLSYFLNIKERRGKHIAVGYSVYNPKKLVNF